MKVFENIDCMEGMAEYPDKHFDLAIVDPPYGNKIDSRNKIRNGGPFGGIKNLKKYGKMGGDNLINAKIYKIFDDSKPPGKIYFDELFRISKNQIIWGGNFFGNYLPATSCMIVWDKDNAGNFADCELAWTSFKTAVRKFKFRWNGLLQENMKNKEIRIHPTQKPIALYRWLLEKYAKPGDLILDTHVGSASSLIACESLGFDYVGFEIDEDYYQAAQKRIEEWRSLPLFDLIINQKSEIRNQKSEIRNQQLKYEY
jgi:site-specific DNA-methyltransferase (adenine-specific)